MSDLTSAPPFVYLASQSPRRLDLLSQWGVRCETLLPDPSEDAEALEAQRPGEAPARYVQRVTRLKLQAALQRWARRGLVAAPVLCADTTVALGRTILGKPTDEAHARAMLTALSGQTHTVLTAVAVARPGTHPLQLAMRLSRSRVRFARLADDEIRRYVATGEPMGKAGAYGIQGRAALWTEHLGGSYSGIVGLPAFETAAVLRDVGIALF